MRRRPMPKQETIRECVVTSDGYTYKYTLAASAEPDPMYSLKVVMSSVDGEISSDTASIAMADGGRAIAFYNKLVRNLATPKNLKYCIEDEFS